MKVQLYPGGYGAGFDHGIARVEIPRERKALPVSIVVHFPAPGATGYIQMVSLDVFPAVLRGLQISFITRRLIKKTIAQKVGHELIRLAFPRINNASVFQHVAHQTQLWIVFTHRHDMLSKLEKTFLVRPLIEHHDGFKQRRRGNPHAGAVFGQVGFALSIHLYQ